MKDLQPAMAIKKTQPSFELITKMQTAPIKLGGKLYISVEDARMMYNMTTVSKKEVNSTGNKHESININRDYYVRLFNMRDMLRAIAKKVLFTEGESTDYNEFMHKLNTNDMETLKNEAEQAAMETQV